MARTALYSRSPRRAAALAAAAAASAAAAAPPPPTPLQRAWRRAMALLQRHERAAWATAALLLALVAGWPAWTQRIAKPPSFEELDAALRESIAKEPLPSVYAAAYDGIIQSVVRVVGERDAPKEKAEDFKLGAPPGASAPATGKAAAPRLAKPGTAPGGKPSDKPGDKPGAAAKPGDKTEAKPEGMPNPEDQYRSVGTGVVIVDKGLILTNLHVVMGADRIKVTFFDGSTSEARIVNVQPEHDLAVLQALTIPDDLHAATMRSTSGLNPGDQVLAVGFPFGIGPSASGGVVSGLKREFRSPEGERVLTNLIQFDAAANPGNSGGPLVTMDGHVVGIVTAIMNPTRARTFLGIAFAVPIENAAGAAGLPPF